MVLITQLLDDLPLDIIFCSACHFGTDVNAACPQLLWTHCSEYDDQNRYDPSADKYLDSEEIIEPNFGGVVGSLADVSSESEAEESTESGSSDHDYNEHLEEERAAVDEEAQKRARERM